MLTVSWVTGVAFPGVGWPAIEKPFPRVTGHPSPPPLPPSRRERRASWNTRRGRLDVLEKSGPQDSTHIHLSLIRVRSKGTAYPCRLMGRPLCAVTHDCRPQCALARVHPLAKLSTRIDAAFSRGQLKLYKYHTFTYEDIHEYILESEKERT